MKITVALDSFKGSCSAREACDAVAQGIYDVMPQADVVTCPVSDGGEGLIDALWPVLSTRGYKRQVRTVSGPYGGEVRAAFLVKDQECVMEMAQCCGLELVDSSRRNGLDASTYGLGELMGHALDMGCRTFRIGLGGSATSDGGLGFAQALGARFYSSGHTLIKDRICAGLLHKISEFDTEIIDRRLEGISISGTCDVANILTGSGGAIHVFGPQKGLPANLLDELDADMAHVGAQLDLHYSISACDTPGAGAAGGLGAALLWFGRARLKRGIEVVMEILDVERDIADSALVITGEGRMDGQSMQGKAPLGIAAVAARHGVPAIALCGSIADDADVLYQHNITAMFSLCNGPMSLDQAVTSAPVLLRRAAGNIMRTIAPFTNRQ